MFISEIGSFRSALARCGSPEPERENAGGGVRVSAEEARDEDAVLHVRQQRRPARVCRAAPRGSSCGPWWAAFRACSRSRRRGSTSWSTPPSISERALAAMPSPSNGREPRPRLRSGSSVSVKALLATWLPSLPSKKDSFCWSDPAVRGPTMWRRSVPRRARPRRGRHGAGAHLLRAEARRRARSRGLAYRARPRSGRSPRNACRAVRRSPRDGDRPRPSR